MTTRSEPIRVMANMRSFDFRCNESEQRMDQYRNIFDDVESRVVSRVASLEASNSAIEAALVSMKQSHVDFSVQFRQFHSESGIDLEPPNKKYKDPHYESYPAGTKWACPLEGSTGIDPSPSNTV